MTAPIEGAVDPIVEPNAEQGPKTPTFEAITSQEQLDKVVGQRVARERAKFANYDDLKTKAEEFDKLQEASKSELQKANERASAAEKRAEQAEFASLRSDVARTKGVPASSLTGSTKEELEASADELIAWRDQNAPKPPTRKLASDQKSGATGSGVTNSNPKAAAAEALRKLRAGS